MHVNTTEIRVETDASTRVMTITIDGPDTRNSIGAPQYEAMRAAMVDAGIDAGVGAIVLTGANGFFSSGGNLHALQESREMSLAEVSRSTDALFAMIMAMRTCPKPIIGAVEGGAAGLGLSVALACDMLVATEGAGFTAAYVKIGLTPDGGATHFLREALPRQLVSEMCLLGRTMPAERLQAAGVINALCGSGEAVAQATELARACAKGAGRAMAMIKEEIEAAPLNGVAKQVELEGRGINLARYGDEAGEGMAAFLEKRKPNFQR